MDEVKKLAALARIEVGDSELKKFAGEFDAILAYVGQLENINLPQGAAVRASLLRNVMRPDIKPHASNAYTEKLAVQFPSREGDALVVKQVISHD
ncbi:aspartyl/glutamyl-tRNA amidotransferase subunit C [Candidatus Parcubacteria bacterium]|nr:aspartyl/glutamyl-tRNA amidotransferase subunit C [Candidatus Parcubacteria bacterium]